MRDIELRRRERHERDRERGRESHTHRPDDDDEAESETTTDRQTDKKRGVRQTDDDGWVLRQRVAWVTPRHSWPIQWRLGWGGTP